MTRRRERITLAALLLATFGLRAWRADQPIVENYVGRQVPTAMVARNIQRGSGLLRPQLDTGPFPNLFLVEPPIYAAAVAAFGKVTRLPIGPSGRIVSALATTLGAWGLFGLARRREGPGVALVAVAVFATMPVMIRYGRAVQPDAMMLGTQLAALRCWDAFASGRGRGWLALGWILLATSLALKVTSAYVLVPLAVAILGPGRKRTIGLAVLALVPALLWYAHAAAVLAEGEGSRASLENGRIWLSAIVPTALLRFETYRPAARYLLVRAFTPIGLALAVAGLARARPVDRLWWTWGASALLALVALAAKWHHEYYWMVLGPVVSVGIARSLAAVASSTPGGRWGAAVLGMALLALSAIASASTWRTPDEWRGLGDAAEAVRRVVPEGRMVVAPEALLFEADRRGCRLEHPPRAARRAAGEWGGRLEEPVDALALVEFYRARGAEFLADLGLGPDPEADPDPRRAALRNAARRRYRVLVDRPAAFVAELVPRSDAQGTPHVEPSAEHSRPERPRHPAGAGPMEARGAEDRRPDRLRPHDGPAAR